MLAVVTVLSFPRHVNTFQYHAELGRPWSSDPVTAKHDFPIYKTDAQLEADRRQALANFTPYYTHVGDRPENILSYQEYNRLQQEGHMCISVLKGNIATVYPLTDIYTPRTAYEQTHEEGLLPTLVLDTAMTEKVYQSILSSVSLTSGMVQAGERIIDKGDIVKEYDLQVLMSYKRSYEELDLSAAQLYCSTLGNVILVVLYIMMFGMYLIVFRSKHLERLENVLYLCTLSGILIVLSCLLVRFTTFSIYLIPFTWVPVLTRIFFDSRTALYHHLITTLIVSLVVSTPYEFLIIQTAVGMVTVATLRNLTRRSQLFRTAICVFVTYSIAYTGFRWAMTGEFDTLHATVYADFLLNAILIVCAYGLIYFFERIFGLMSSITLIELTDLNHPLLHEFSEHAPGSFQHSMQVSNMATDAAKAIEADSLLVRTAALYHDIGKLAHPEFFTENQQDGENPLLEMAPKDAAQVVIRHVSDGVELAHKHQLPERVVRFITSHHGMGLVRYFYTTAHNAGENPDPADYQYPGPRPKTKEEAILMMADAVEARSRSLKDYSEKSLTDMVNAMIDSQISEGQFADCHITFDDVTKIKQVFVQRLQVINHHRIKYPKAKK